MNGKGRGPMDPRAAAAMAAAAGMHAKQVTPDELMGMFMQFFGLSGIAMQGLQAKLVPCMCGACQGIRIQLDGAMHFPLAGSPAIITRGDAARAPVAPPQEPPAEGGASTPPA